MSFSFGFEVTIVQKGFPLHKELSVTFEQPKAALRYQFNHVLSQIGLKDLR